MPKCKRLLTTIFVAVAILSLTAACNTKADAPTPTPTPSPAAAKRDAAIQSICDDVFARVAQHVASDGGIPSLYLEGYAQLISSAFSDCLEWWSKTK